MAELDTIDWNEILQKLESLATSHRGRARLAQLTAFDSAEQAHLQMEEISHAQNLLRGGERPFMESLDLFPIWHERLKKKAVLKTLELKDVRKFCHETLALAEVLKKSESGWSQHLQSQLVEAQAPLSAIDHLLTPAGEIRSDASETLHRLYHEKSQQARSIQQLLDRLIKQHDMEPVLQDKYVTNREGRWVLPIRGGMQHAFSGIIHASSQSKQTVFMEPEETIPINNRLAQIEIEIEEEIERLLMELSNYLGRLAADFERTAGVLEVTDVRLAQGQLAGQLNATPCRFTNGRLRLKGLRHPLLALNNETVVANDVDLDLERRILLLSGPNAGGKTVLLKSIGLAAHMARCGLPICAEEGSQLPLFNSVYVAVGDEQSIGAHLSTFAAHLKILNEATQAVGPNHLLLIDEIAGATDPEEGSALARSFIECYARNQVFAVITSHLSPLKMGWERASGVVNGSLEYDAGSGRPTYHFLMGIPGQSLALQTAKRVGVAADILNRAYELLSPESKAHQQSLQQMEEMEEDIQRLRATLEQDVRKTREQKHKYMQMIEQFRKERDQWMERAIQKAEKKLDEAIDKAKVDSIFRKHQAMSQIRQQFPVVVQARASQPGRLKAETSEEFAKIYPPGSTVFIPSVHQDGVVQGTPNSKGEVPVLSQSMRLFVSWQDLQPARQASNPTGQILRRTSVQVALSESDRVVDVRGQRVEEALENLEIQLDAASAAHEDRLKIVHGHGTEALKRALRSYLSRSIYVKKWKAGTPESGGDGITWVELRDTDD